MSRDVKVNAKEMTIIRGGGKRMPGVTVDEQPPVDGVKGMISAFSRHIPREFSAVIMLLFIISVFRPCRGGKVIMRGRCLALSRAALLKIVP